MAPLPDPRPHLGPDALADLRRLTAVRSHAEGRAEVSAVYLAMFNNPAVARPVAALGEQLRFRGTLPDRIREIAILRFVGRQRFEYAWAHHQRPARLAGLSPDLIGALAQDENPPGLSDAERATVQAVDQIAARKEISESVQSTLANELGEGGLVELVILCGTYALMGYMTTAFAIEVEPDLGGPEA